MANVLENINKRLTNLESTLGGCVQANDHALDICEAADFLGLTMVDVLRLIAQGVLKPQIVNRALYFPQKELESYSNTLVKKEESHG